MLVTEPIRASAPLAVFSSLLVFSPLIEGGTTQLPVLIIRLILLAALMAWVAVAMREGRMVLYPTCLYMVVAVFVAWATLSVLRSAYQAPGINWLVTILSYAVLLFLVLHLVESSNQVRWLVAVVLGMGIFEASVGMYQFLWVGDARAKGTFFNPNFFAAYEMAVFSLAFGLLCFSSPTLLPQKLFLWLTAGATAFAFVLAQSRGAALALVVAVTFIGFYRFRRAFLAILLLVLLAGAAIPNPLQQRVLSVGSQDPYAFTRWEIWHSSLQRLADHPLGVGLGQYKYTSFQYRFPIEGEIVRYGKRAESAHSGYVQMAVELGAPGLAVFLIGAGLMGREIFETQRLDLEPWERGVVIGLSGGMVGLLAHAAVDSVFHEPALVVLLALFAGVILAVQRLTRLKTPDSVPPWMIPFPASPARVALVGVLAIVSALLIVRPAAAWYAFAQGEAETQAGHVEKGLDWYRWATQIDPGVSGYHDAVARSEVARYQQTGDARHLRDAVDEFSLALALNPLDARLAHRMGNSYALLADIVDSGASREECLRQAAIAYEEAIRLDPYSPFGYFELGRIRGVQGQRDQAQALFRTAIEREPNFLPARVRLVEIALQNGMKEVAASEYAAILHIQERYKGRTLNLLERQFLDVNHQHLKSLVAPARAS